MPGACRGRAGGAGGRWAVDERYEGRRCLRLLGTLTDVLEEAGFEMADGAWHLRNEVA